MGDYFMRKKAAAVEKYVRAGPRLHHFAVQMKVFIFLQSLKSRIEGI